MDTIFKNYRKSKKSDPHRLLLNISDKINLKRNDKYVALSNLSIYYIWKNIKNSYKNNKFKISAPTWNEEFELSNALYFVSHIQDYFEYILETHGEKTDDILIIYKNKTENRIKFRIRTGYYFKLFTPETMKILGSTKSKITNNKSGENMPHLEITKVLLLHCNTINSDYLFFFRWHSMYFSKEIIQRHI